MRQLFFILFLVISFSSSYGENITDARAIKLISGEIESRPKLVLTSPLIMDIYSVSFNKETVTARGKYNKDEKFLPIRVRISGNGITTHNHMTKVKDSFDKVIDARLKTNDFEEWEVEIIKVTQTPDSIKAEKWIVPVSPKFTMGGNSSASKATTQSLNKKLFKLFEKDDVSFKDVKSLLSRGASANAKQDFVDSRRGDYMSSILIVAARVTPDLEIIKLLLKAGADVNYYNDNHGGRSAITNSVSRNQNIEITKELVKAGADLSVKTKRGTLLYSATHNANIEVMKYLVNEKNLSVKNDDSQNPAILTAGLFGSIELVKFLIKNGANSVATDEEGENLLLQAIQNRDINVLLYVLNMKKNPVGGKLFDVNKKDKEGRTAFFIGLGRLVGDEENFISKIKILQQAGADFTIENKLGLNILDKLYSNYNFDVNVTLNGEDYEPLIKKLQEQFGLLENKLSQKEQPLNYTVKKAVRNNSNIHACNVDSKDKYNTAVKVRVDKVGKYNEKNKYWPYKISLSCLYEGFNKKTSRQNETEEVKKVIKLFYSEDFAEWSAKLN